MADSILDEKRKYNPEPSAAGQAGATLGHMYHSFVSQKSMEEEQKGRYKRTIYTSERQKTPEEIKNEEIAKKFGL